MDKLAGVARALSDVRNATLALLESQRSRNVSPDLIERNVIERAAAIERLQSLVVNDGQLDIASLTTTLTDNAKLTGERLPRASSAFLNNEPFTVVEDHYVYANTQLRVTAPPIVVSFDIKRSYVSELGYGYSRKLAGVGRQRISDYVSWASGIGCLRIDEIRSELRSTTGIARVKTILINGKSEDFRMKPAKGFPFSIDVIDVRIDDLT